MGKKKKSLASKFAKMSDDQRAKYMQLKADQEEEVRRRKEQLLTTFMKNKIRKEDGFSRLNRAKINLQWHQFLRVRKCREMKENCEHMKRWIDRTINLKNRIIDNLVKELDETEFQYSNNLQSHLLHIDETIDFYDKYADQLKRQFDSDSKLLLEESIFEVSILHQRYEDLLIHLKTIIYGQDVQGRASIRDNHDYYLKRLDAFSKECKWEWNQLKKSKENASGAIWNEIATRTKLYVDQTDKRRAQLAEMRRLDAESAQEISNNQERINLFEIQIQKYKEEYTTLVQERTETANTLIKTVDDLNKMALKSKRNLQKELEHDDEKLRILSQCSKEAMDSLERVERKGEHLLQLAQSCRKYETQKEKVLRFWKESVDEQHFVDEKADDDDDLVDDLEEVMKITMQEQKEPIAPEEEDELTHEDQSGIYKTETYKILIRQKFKMKPTTSQVKIGEKLQRELEKVEFPSTCPKRRQKQSKDSPPEKSGSSTKSSSSDAPTGIIDECVASLMQLDGMWNLCNKVKIDCSELRAEKLILLEENKQSKAMLKIILEEAILESRAIPKMDVRLKRYASARVRYT